MKSVFFLLSSLLLAVLVLNPYITTSNAQKIEFVGGCPNVTAKQDFNGSLFTGKWYEAARYISWYDPVGHCNTKSVTGGPTKFDVTLTSYNLANNNLPQIVTFNLKNTGNASVAQFTAKFSLAGVPFGPKFSYTILETDYNKYAVAHSCIDMKFMRLRFAWIYTRSKIPLFEMKTAYNVLDAKGVNRTGLWPTDQLICPPH